MYMIYMISRISGILCCLVMAATIAGAQATPNGPIEPPRKANVRAPAAAAITAEPFDGASIEKMASQCVTLETELGAIEIAFA